MFKKSNCFLIMVHKDFELCKMSIERLSRTNDVFVHVDLKSEHLYNDLVCCFSLNKNIFFIESRYDIKWGGMTVVKAFRALLKTAEFNQYTHYTLLSAECVPVKPISHFNHYLKSKEGVSFINSLPNEEMRYRSEDYNFILDNRLYSYIIARYLSRGIKYILNKFRIKNLTLSSHVFHKGELWMTLSHSAVSYLNYVNIDSYINKLKFSEIPDEFLFHTILNNSNLEIENKNLMYINWHGGDGLHPGCLTMADLDNCVSDTFFARKFCPENDRNLTKFLVSAQLTGESLLGFTDIDVPRH